MLWGGKHLNMAWISTVSRWKISQQIPGYASNIQKLTNMLQIIRKETWKIRFFWAETMPSNSRNDLVLNHENKLVCVTL